MFKTKPMLDRLRETHGTAALPDSIDTTFLGEFGQPIHKPIAQASIDDIAFAIQALEDDSSVAYRRLSALRQLHERARRAGGLGAELAVEAALRNQEGGR
jgi:hypothetical protein